MVVSTISEVPITLLEQIGRIGLWLSAAGIIFVSWFIFQIVNFIINRKRMKEIYAIKSDMQRMEEKLDRLLKKR